jgi:two-component system, chemotaxis family, chemotaxis protein CheY
VKILIADDSRVMRSIVLRALRQAGYGDADVVQAEDGAHALKMIEEENPDLVLSDWNMPHLTGLDVLKSLRASGDQRAFGFVTSEGSVEMRTLAQEAGALFLIAKPFTADAFRDVLALAGG